MIWKRFACVVLVGAMACCWSMHATAQGSTRWEPTTRSARFTSPDGTWSVDLGNSWSQVGPDEVESFAKSVVRASYSRDGKREVRTVFRGSFVDLIPEVRRGRRSVLRFTGEGLPDEAICWIQFRKHEGQLRIDQIRSRYASRLEAVSNFIRSWGLYYHGGGAYDGEGDQRIADIDGVKALEIPLGRIEQCWAFEALGGSNRIVDWENMRGAHVLAIYLIPQDTSVVMALVATVWAPHNEVLKAARSLLDTFRGAQAAPDYSWLLPVAAVGILFGICIGLVRNWWRKRRGNNSTT